MMASRRLQRGMKMPKPKNAEIAKRAAAATANATAGRNRTLNPNRKAYNRKIGKRVDD